jgi:hypothetical protein
MKITYIRGGKLISRNAFSKKRPPAMRFLSFIKKTDACWNWIGALKENGYGAFGVNAKSGYAHRFSYEHFHGPIPKGLTIDHLCKNRRCVNPDHLEAVTQRENNLRSDSLSAQCARKTHCPKGHPYDSVNTYKCRGRRQCRICRAAYGIEWRIRNPGYSALYDARTGRRSKNRDLIQPQEPT